ncbi:MAG: DNA-binding response regulator [Thermosynechococcaceae cyanobacterium]
MLPEQEQEIMRLRASNLTPKQIARKLGLRVAEVTAFVREKAHQQELVRAESGVLDPVAECWIDSDAAHALFGIKPANNTDDVAPEIGGGLTTVLVVRATKYNRFLICTYLVDYWCLGLKNTIGPRKLDSLAYKHFVSTMYEAHSGEPQHITLSQAQAVVFSALDYAERLGFKPHQDLAKTRPHLGEWDGQHRIECGREGKPFYICGPRDNSAQIIKTLTQNVGTGNFNYLVDVGSETRWF